MLLKYSYYGLQYFPVLDDNNMYGVFSMMTPVDALMLNRWYTTRPVAGLLDTFVWSRLWSHQWIVLLTITGLHFLGIVLLWRVLELNHLKAGATAAVLFSLLPFGIEATYWVAASSRLVVGFFWACLSLYLLMLFIRASQGGNPKANVYLAGFWAANLLSLGFYEQVIAFSLGATLLVLAVNSRRLRGVGPHPVPPGGGRRVRGVQSYPLPLGGGARVWGVLRGMLACAVPFVNLAIVGLWYRAFSLVGNVAARGQLIRGNYREHTIEVWERIRGLLVADQWEMFKYGTIEGWRLVVSDRAYPYLAAVLVVSVLLAVFVAREKETVGKESEIPQAGPGVERVDAIPGASPGADLRANALKFALGGLLLILPFAPFFLLSAAWIYNRNAFLSLLGLGLMAEAVVRTARVVSAKAPAGVLPGLVGLLVGLLVGVLAFASLLANASGVADFRAVSLADREICQGFIRAAKAADLNWYEREILLFGAQPLYPTLNVERLANCTASDWAMTGAVQVAGGNLEIRPISPVADGAQLALTERALGEALYLGIDGGMKTFPLLGTWKGGTLELRSGDGAVFGKLVPKGGSPPRFSFSLAGCR